MTRALVGALSMLAFALPMLAYAVWQWRRVRDARGWRRVPARIVRSWLAEVDLGGGDGPMPGWQPRVVFSYELDGRPLQSSLYCVDDLAYRYGSHKKARQQLGKTPAGQVVDAWVSPEGLTVLRPDVDWTRQSHYLGVGASGLLLLVVSAGLAWLHQQG